MKKYKEWLKNEIENMGSETSENYPHEQMVDREEVLNLIDQLDKPRKVIIPQFVADWWERDGDSVTMYGGESIDKKRKLDLVSCFQDRGLIDSLSKVEVWIDENESNFLDLVNGKVYEVEKEQLYYVLNKQGKTLLMLMSGEVCTSGGYALSESTFTKDIYQLTEKQIKDYDERYWQFAVEVAE